MSNAAASERALTVAAQLLGRRVGLRLDPAIRGRLARCVIDAAEVRNESVTTYVASLEAQPAALQDLLNRVTVQETAFFRDPNQFVALADHVLAGLVPPVTIWSAGCANGQEAYSLAMALEESGCPAWRVVATDLSTRALERARQARYASRELAGLSPERRQRFLVPAGSSWEITPELRQRVDFAHHNLAADPPPFEVGRCQVVFCRNVLIYFRHDEVVAFLERLAQWLPPGGWLFLGYSESLWQVTERFSLVRVGDAFVYRRPEPGIKPSERKAAAPVRGRASAAGPRRSTSVAETARSENTRGAVRRHAERDQVTPMPVPSAPEPTPTMADLLAAGEAAIDARDYGAAVTAFRKCAYLDPDQPIAHLHLGLALEAAGDPSAARRAFAAARTALDRGDTGAIEVTLEGYHVAELVRLLDGKLTELTPVRGSTEKQR